MLCTKYTLTSGDEYLTNELAAAIASQGHQVQAVVLEWSAPCGAAEAAPCRRRRRLGASAVYLEAIGRLGAVASKWVLSSLRATFQMRPALRGRHLDMLIAFSPLCAVAAQVLWLARRFKTRNYLALWDFFPDHHRSIGLIPDGWPFAIARRLEQSLIHRFDVIDSMSPRNAAYLQDHYGLRPNQRTDILPIWARIATQPTMSGEHVRTAFGLPHDKTIVVHGGQIAEGRGIDDILAAAAIARRDHSSLTFLLIGEGRITGAINAHIAEGADNVIYRPRIPRQDYPSVVSACDVGIVCTVGNVDVPTFPSKIIDYLRVGLPVVESVETSTDYGRFIQNNGVGLAVGAANPRAMLGAIAHDGVVRKRMVETGRRVLTEWFYVQRVAARLLGSLSPLPSDALAHGPAA